MDITPFFNHQLEFSEQYRKTFNNIEQSKVRTLQFDGFRYVLQLNPGRIKSSTANIDKPLDESKCFLCRHNMFDYQLGMDYDKEFTIFVNPFPILRRHLTIVSRKHTPQTIHGHTMRMLQLARDLEGEVVFYNSPKSGASAPFHCHFQAGLESDLPVFVELQQMKEKYCVESRGIVSKIDDGTRRFVIITTPDIQKADDVLKSLLMRIDNVYHTTEPEANIGIIYKECEYRVVIFPRERHRPQEYFREENRILVSPGFADMAGIIPCSIPANYDSITIADIASIMDQVSISKENFKNL